MTMKNHHLSESDFDDILFENRNQNYGAFVLRNTYNQHLSWAMGITITILFIFFGFNFLLAASKEEIGVEDSEVIILSDEIILPPTIEPPIAIPPSEETISEAKTIQHVEPKVIITDNGTEDYNAPTVSELENNTVGTVTNTEGENNTNPGELDETGSVGGETTNSETSTPIYPFTEEMPEFVGGLSALYTYLQKATKYPTIAFENNIEGKVVISFVVGIDGSILQPTILRGIGGGCDEEALRIIKKMPKWKPGKHNGRFVPVRYTIPIQFKIEN
jgi:periplasmic protein TonB